MSLINCPECGRENVSDQAEACPGCGYAIKKHFKQQAFNENAKNLKTNAKQAITERVDKVSEVYKSKTTKPMAEVNTDSSNISTEVSTGTASVDDSEMKSEILPSVQVQPVKKTSVFDSLLDIAAGVVGGMWKLIVGLIIVVVIGAIIFFAVSNNKGSFGSSGSKPSVFNTTAQDRAECENFLYGLFDEFDDVLRNAFDEAIRQVLYQEIGISESNEINTLISDNISAAYSAFTAGRSMQINDFKKDGKGYAMSVTVSNASFDSGLRDMVLGIARSSLNKNNLLTALWVNFSSNPYEFANNIMSNLWDGIRENRVNAPKVTSNQTLQFSKVNGQWVITNEEAFKQIAMAYIGCSGYDQLIMDYVQAYEEQNGDYYSEGENNDNYEEYEGEYVDMYEDDEYYNADEYDTSDEYYDEW